MHPSNSIQISKHHSRWSNIGKAMSQKFGYRWKSKKMRKCALTLVSTKSYIEMRGLNTLREGHDKSVAVAWGARENTKHARPPLTSTFSMDRHHSIGHYHLFSYVWLFSSFGLMHPEWIYCLIFCWSVGMQKKNRHDFFVFP